MGCWGRDGWTVKSLLESWWLSVKSQSGPGCVVTQEVPTISLAQTRLGQAGTVASWGPRYETDINITLSQ